MDYTVHEILQAGILELGSRSLLQGIFPTKGLYPGLATLLVDFSPDPEIEPGSPALQADSLPTGYQGSPVLICGRPLF